MADKIEVLAAEDHKCGLSIIMTVATFRKLKKQSTTQDMEGWSATIVRLIEKAK